MNKAKIIWTGVLLASALIGFVIFDQLDRDVIVESEIEPSRHVLDNNNHAKTRDSGKKPTEIGIEHSPNLQIEPDLQRLIFDFYAADSGGAAQAVIEAMEASGFERAAQELGEYLAAVCPVDGMRRTTPDPQQFADKLDWIVEKLDRYCDSVSFSDEEFIEYRARYAASASKQIEAKNQELKQIPESEHEKFLWDSIRSAETWEDIEAIKRTMILPQKYNEQFVYNLGQDSSFIGDSGRTVQRSALHLYQCETMGGGCTANNPRTLEACYFSLQCEPGWSMHDLYSNTLSPVEFQQVLNILDFLYSLSSDP